MTEVKTSESEEHTLNAKGYKLIKFLGEGAYAKVTFIDLMCTKFYGYGVLFGVCMLGIVSRIFYSPTGIFNGIYGS